jgi:hypothetical protein
MEGGEAGAGSPTVVEGRTIFLSTPTFWHRFSPVIRRRSSLSAPLSDLVQESVDRSTAALMNGQVPFRKTPGTSLFASPRQ